MTETIPGPTGLPILGNMLDVQGKEGYLRATENLAEIYGPIYRLSFQGSKQINISSAELMMEFLDDKTWTSQPLEELTRGQEAQGVFSAATEDPDWGQARRIFNPHFGQLSVENMYEKMTDISNQMILKWARMGDGHQVLLTDDFTRLTLDTIALCTMDYRFNSFYKDEMHPFVDAMVTFLKTGGEMSSRPWIINKLFPGMENKKLATKKILDDVAQSIIDERRRNPKPGNDLVNVMLFDKDPQTDERMRDSLIRENMVILLIAGHETTSSLLSFVCSNLMENPRMFLRAREEVDQVIGTGPVTPAKLKKLKYLNACLRETLRLTPTIPSLTKRLHLHKRGEPVVVGGGRYLIDDDAVVEIMLTKAQRDPDYFGPDAHEFKPERMMDDNPQFADFMKVWKPFGYGARTCLGQQFAWLETMQILAMVLQNFDLDFSDPGYQMRIAEALTIKPDDLWVKVRLRDGITLASLESRLGGTPSSVEEKPESTDQPEKAGSDDKPQLCVLYGSNTGSCQSMAQKLASSITSNNKLHVIMRDLNSVAGSMPDCPVIIITATYEGGPPDNAGRFVSWLEDLKGNELLGVKYAVFGLGDKNWHSTFHRIPKLVDETLGARGAERFLPLRAIDVSEGSILDELETWNDDCLQPALQKLLGVQNPGSPGNTEESVAEIKTDLRATSISNGMVLGKVIDARVLTRPGQPEKRHIEIKLPQGVSYECGDYLTILPLNPEALVRRIMAHWDLPWDSTIVLKSKLFEPLLTNVPLSISEILTGYLELSQSPTKKSLQTCLKYTDDDKTHSTITNLIEKQETRSSTNDAENYQSLFDILVDNPEIKMPFEIYLSTLISLRPRQYSISSSPVTNPTSCTLTYGVLRSNSEGSSSSRPTFQGVASNFLANLEVDDTIQVVVARTATANKPCPFRLPADQNATPLLMIAAGTGLAPFRGFIQQRARMIEINESHKDHLAPATLFVGCRSQTEDRLYAEEMDHWSNIGAVDIHYAFSREPENSHGCKYVADRIWLERDKLDDLWKAGARMYICGSRGLLSSIEDVVVRSFEEEAAKVGGGREMVEREMKKFQDECNERAVSDIFD